MAGVPFDCVVTPVLSLRRTRCDRRSGNRPGWLSHRRRTVHFVSAGEAAFVFLRSPEGRTMVVRALQRRGLPLGLHDDLVSEIVRRVITADRRQPIDNPAGFATHAAQYAAADLLRGEHRAPT